MTGPEHYREAERLLQSCQISPANGSDAAIYPEREGGVDTCGNALAAAQVHATLALAAAQAPVYADMEAWTEATGAPRGQGMMEPSDD